MKFVRFVAVEIRIGPISVCSQTSRQIGLMSEVHRSRRAAHASHDGLVVRDSGRWGFSVPASSLGSRSSAQGVYFTPLRTRRTRQWTHQQQNPVPTARLTPSADWSLARLGQEPNHPPWARDQVNGPVFSAEARIIEGSPAAWPVLARVRTREDQGRCSFSLQ